MMSSHYERSRLGGIRLRRTAAVVGVCAAFLVVCVPAAGADPIKPSIEGCATELPGNRATWTADRHFQFVAFWDPVAGCEPTIAHPIVLHEWFENYDGTGGLKVETLFDRFPRCGRIQFDAQTYISADSDILDESGLVSLVFDTGVDCRLSGKAESFALHLVAEPPSFLTAVPEPAAALLVMAGAAMLASRLPRRRPERAR